MKAACFDVVHHLCFCFHAAKYYFIRANLLRTTSRKWVQAAQQFFRPSAAPAGLDVERAEAAMCNAGFGFIHGSLGPAP
jgi:hypothetical protein